MFLIPIIVIVGILLVAALVFVIDFIFAAVRSSRSVDPAAKFSAGILTHFIGPMVVIFNILREDKQSSSVAFYQDYSVTFLLAALIYILTMLAVVVYETKDQPGPSVHLFIVLVCTLGVLLNLELIFQSMYLVLGCVPIICSLLTLLIRQHRSLVGPSGDPTDGRPELLDDDLTGIVSREKKIPYGFRPEKDFFHGLLLGEPGQKFAVLGMLSGMLYVALHLITDTLTVWYIAN